ncbi:hypothetical protein M655_009070 [Brevibacillus sp. NSP2.1]|uniref:hypothetical protein n=1 Tax=Brevibacillus sp. NSP2.1 TaxID=3003229 RepID=UPI00047B6DE9|nr:hypothetical protein [Brevibacillus sp. NSP2.1]QHZ55781.1 hypothetical protein M655_009070 [Brevibacillus sp. NSP2.1]
MDETIRELTILYMKNSVKLSDYQSPEDYARIYLENYYRIKNELSASKAGMKSEQLQKLNERGKGNSGWI